MSLVDRTQGPPTLPNGHPFDDVQSSRYWSATTDAVGTSFARVVLFVNGFVFDDVKGVGNFVWCVRGGQGHDGF